ncbi:MAG: hypothetical protein M5R41_00835 [Bacteroidia bacterium]|nr:hypothetical protein [Bacteroidia bacterium]
MNNINSAFKCIVLIATVWMLLPAVLAAQDWAWMHGTRTINERGIYGTLGLPDSLSTPGSRSGAFTWKAKDGTFRLFGGNTRIAGLVIHVYNDLWKFDANTNLWTWMHGPDSVDDPGQYGTRSMSSAANVPPGREAGVSWVDRNGNLWMFGGSKETTSGLGTDYFNDLWMFDAERGEWVWMHGSNKVDQNGVYGTKGLPNGANTPGSREGSVGWTDLLGNLWLYGGRGVPFSQITFNDLWKFDAVQKTWTWMQGDDNTNKLPVYGTLGVPASGNQPGGRFSATAWSDSEGNFWLFGGMSVEGSVTYKNDLWKFMPSTGQWTWVHGPKETNIAGVYGMKGVPDHANVPGARRNSVGWTADDGMFWLFGGEHYDSKSGRFHLQNDLWRYDPRNNEWTWIAGAKEMDEKSQYGIRGIPSTGNAPGARKAAAAWAHNNSEFWMFGGLGYTEMLAGFTNDLWRISTFVNNADRVDEPRRDVSLSLIGSEPFSKRFTISCRASGNQSFLLEIRDLHGRRVHLLTEGIGAPEERIFVWDASAMPPGVYFCCLHVGEIMKTMKILLLR